jgi:serine/threonine protein kinase
LTALFPEESWSRRAYWRDGERPARASPAAPGGTTVREAIMPDTPLCPDCHTLERFLLGQNSPEEAAAVEAHLESCASCLTALRTVSADDSLVEAIQARPNTTDVAMCEGARLLAEWLKKLRPESDSTASYDLPPATSELGQYKLRRVLGSGGMGIVFEAYDPQLDRLVALKTMLPAQAAKPAARQRFLREARAAAAIKHDHIVTIYQVGEDRGLAFLAMELLEGETLGQRLDREGRLPLADLLRIGRECADALSAAHAKSLIHRDIKPANIWLEKRSQESGVRNQEAGITSQEFDSQGTIASAKASVTSACRLTPDSDLPGQERVKLVDFGLALAPDDATHLTLSGAVVGTPAFMAPEQLRGQPVDTRADLFSLGCVLYRMTTGEAPFKAVHSVSTLIAIATTNPRPPQEFRPEAPLPLCELIMGLLAKDPDERPPTARAVVETIYAIEEYVRQPSASKPRPLSLKPTVGRAAAVMGSPAVPRHSYRFIGAAAVALAACWLGWTAYQGWHTHDDGSAGRAPDAAMPANEDPATVTGSGTSRGRVYTDRSRALLDVLDYRDLIGASEAELRDWHAHLEPGFRLAYVTCRRGTGPALLNAVAIREKTSVLGLVEFGQSSEEAIDAAMSRYPEADGYSLLDHCTYPSEKTGWAQTRIWVKDGTRFLSVDQDLWGIKQRFTDQKALGRRLRCVQWLAGDPWPYQAIFADDGEGRGWETSYSLSREELVRAVQRHEHKSWRPDLLVPYWENEQLRFLMIAVENADGPDWRFRMDMTAESYRHESDEQRRLGFFPICLTSYGAGAGVQYVAIWVRVHAPGASPPPAIPDQQTVADRAANAVSWTGDAPGGLYQDLARALREVLDYQQVVGATSEQFKRWLESLDPKFRVAHVYSRKGRGPALFDAVAVQESNPPESRFHVELTEEEWRQKYKVLQEEEKLRLVAVCTNLSAGQQHPWNISALWVKDGQDAAHPYGWMQNITDGIKDNKAVKRPIYLAGTVSPDGLGCNTVLAPDQGRKWEVFYGLNHYELITTMEFYRNKGWRPDVIAPYWDVEKLRSMLVVVDNFDNVDWRLRMDMTRKEYEEESSRQKQRGLFPLALASYGHDDAVRYAAIFVRYR